MPAVRRAPRVGPARAWACTGLLCLFTLGCGDDGALAPYTDGHADILIELVDADSEPTLDAVLLATGATIDGTFLTGGAVSLADIEVRSKARFVRPDDDGGAFAPVCAEAGEEIPWLPQSLRDANDSDSPFLGIAASFGGADLEDSQIRLALVSVDSPSGLGNYSIWQDGFPPRFFMSSCDGIDAGDDMELTDGHDHYNMGFSEPGEWTVTYRASAVVVGSQAPVETEFEVRYVLE